MSGRLHSRAMWPVRPQLEQFGPSGMVGDCFDFGLVPMALDSGFGLVDGFAGFGVSFALSEADSFFRSRLPLSGTEFSSAALVSC